jgi:hypothetical protein
MTAGDGVFRPLLALAVVHSYFADGACRALRVRPSPQCAELLARNRMRTLETPGGIAVHYLERGQALARYDETAALTFMLDSNDPYLMNYTALDPTPAMERQAAIWYADNRHTSAGVLNPATAPLVRLPLRPARFRLAPAAPVAAAALAVLDVFGVERLAIPVGPAAVRGGIDCDLRGLDDGRYRLFADGAVLLDFYLSDGARPTTWGVLAIYPGARQPQALAEGAAIAADGSVTPRSYHLALHSRATTWRYIVVPKAGAPGERRYAVGGNFGALGRGGDPIVFQADPCHTQVDGRPAMLFSSRDALPLYERPAERMRIALTVGDPEGRESRNLALPYAPANALVRRECDEDGEKFAGYSDIYVYL